MSGQMCMVVIVSLDERRATRKMVVRLSRRWLFKRKREEGSARDRSISCEEAVSPREGSERADRGVEVGERRLKRRGVRGRRRRHRRRVQVTRVIRRVRRVSRELGLVSESTPRRRRVCTS